jgi:uncharacterized protein (TIGR03067 family)
VAYRTAQKARIDSARRRKHEARAAATQVADPLARMTLQEAHEVLHRELARLPDKFRAPLVLCYLEGLTRDEAAHRLGWPVSTLKSRLEQARERLRARLAFRGILLSGGLVASLFGDAAASGAVPSVLLNSTVKAATVVAAGGAAAPADPAGASALTEGVKKAMSVTKFKIAAGLLLVVVCACAAALTQVAGGPVENVRAKPIAGGAGVLDGGGKEAARSDADVLQGAWKVVRTVRNGEAVEVNPKVGPVRLYFQGEKVYEMVGELFREEYAFTLDPAQKPAAIDLTHDRGGTFRAVYRLKGEELTLCRSLDPDAERPTAFASEADSNLELLVLKRDLKAPKLDLEKVKAEQKARAERRPVVEAMLRIVLAMRAYEDDKGAFPAAAIFDGKDNPLLSWRVALLPYLDQQELFDQFKLDEPWDSEHNKKLLANMPVVYGSVGDETVYQVFVGEGTPFDGTKAAKLDDFRDGLDNTILLAVAGKAVPWTRPADLSYAADKPLPKLGGLIKEGFHVAAPDGHVRFVPADFNEKALRALITIAGGEKETFADLLRPEAKGQKKP